MQHFARRLFQVSVTTLRSFRGISSPSTPFFTRFLEPIHNRDRNGVFAPLVPSHHGASHPKYDFSKREDGTWFSGLTPLRSLGGLSMLNYMALHSTTGHFHMYKTWRVDLAQDLVAALDRVEELDLLVRDLTTFVEMQKDELTRMRLQHH